MSNTLPANYREAHRMLALAHRIDEVKSIRDKAVALAVYARQAKDGELISHATAIRKRAERRLGELIEDRRKAGTLAKGGGDKKSDHRVAKKPGDRSLADEGIDKNLADRARKAAAMPEAKFEQQVERAAKLAVAACEGDAAVVKQARQKQQDEKRTRREEREVELAAKITALPNIKAGVIVADPEWRWEPWSRETGMSLSADNHYPTSELEKIKARDVPSISADDCVLFLWATVPMLPQALEVMAAWGFGYVSSFVWVKDRTGTGYWNWNQHELLLVGTKGKIPAPAPGDQWSSVINAPRGAHSEKPEAAMIMIERYFPNLPKIELNCRGKPRPGWIGWGNEAEDAQAAE